MDILNTNIEDVSKDRSSLGPKSINKTDILDSIYNDRNIFSIKHRSMQGSSTPDSCLSKNEAEVKSYIREDDGFFYMAQCGRSLLLTHVSDTKYIVGQPYIKSIEETFQKLHKEAKEIIDTYYSNRIVLVYRVITNATATSMSTKDMSAPLSDISIEDRLLMGALPSIIICPITSISDLAYPDNLEVSSSNGTAYQESIKELIINSKNYAELNFNKIISDAFIAYKYTNDDRQLRMHIEASLHPIQKVTFLSKKILEGYFRGNESNLYKYLNKHGWHKHMNELDYKVYAQHQDSNSDEPRLRIYADPEGDFKHFYASDYARREGSGMALLRDNRNASDEIASLWHIYINGVDRREALLEYDHIKRKENGKGLCDECPYKLMCLLSSNSNIPADINICRSIGIAKGFKALEADINESFLFKRDIYMTVPVYSEESNKYYMTRAAASMAINYADNGGDTEPEDWIISGASLGVLSTMCAEPSDTMPNVGYTVDYGSPWYRLEQSGKTVAGAVFLEEWLQKATNYLSDKIKKHDLSPVRPSNNSQPSCLLDMLVFDSKNAMEAALLELTKLMNNRYSSDDRVYERFASMMRYLFDLISLKENNGLCNNVSVMDDYNRAFNIMKKLTDSGQYLTLNTKTLYAPMFRKMELYLMGLMSVVVNDQEAKYNHIFDGFIGLSVPDKDTHDKWQAIAEKPEMVAAGRLIYNTYNSATYKTQVTKQTNQTNPARSMSRCIKKWIGIAEALRIHKDEAVYLDSNEESERYEELKSKGMLELDTPCGSNVLITPELADIFVNHGIGLEIDKSDIYLIRPLMATAIPVSQIKDMWYVALCLLEYRDIFFQHNDSITNIAGRNPDTTSFITTEYAKYLPDVNRESIPYSVTYEDGSVLYGKLRSSSSGGKVYKALRSKLQSYMYLNKVTNPHMSKSYEILNRIFREIRINDKAQSPNDIVSKILDRLSDKNITMDMSSMFIDGYQHNLKVNANVTATNISGVTYAYTSMSSIKLATKDYSTMTESGVGYATYRGDRIVKILTFSQGCEAQLISTVRDNSRVLMEPGSDANALPVSLNSYATMGNHTSINHSGVTVTNSVLDVMLVHNGSNTVSAHMNVKDIAFVDASPDYITDSESMDAARLKYANITDCDISDIYDYRVTFNKNKVTKHDRRRMPMGNMPSTLGLRPKPPVTQRWKNISHNKEVFESSHMKIKNTICNELAKHKSILWDIVREENLLFHPDYDIDVSFIDTDLSGNTRDTRRVQFRDIYVGNGDSDAYSSVEFPAMMAIARTQSADSGLINKIKVKPHGIDAVLSKEGYKPTIGLLGEFRTQSRRARLLMNQLGALKDIFIEDIDAKTTFISWTLHGRSSVEDIMSARTDNAHAGYDYRDLCAEYASKKVKIVKLDNGSYELHNLPYVSDDKITINASELNKHLRAVIMMAMYYTYRSLLGSDFKIDNISIEVPIPVMTRMELASDLFYSKIEHTHMVGMLAQNPTGESLSVKQAMGQGYWSCVGDPEYIKKYTYSYNVYRSNLPKDGAGIRANQFDGPVSGEYNLATHSFGHSAHAMYAEDRRQAYLPIIDPIQTIRGQVAGVKDRRQIAYVIKNSDSAIVDMQIIKRDYRRLNGLYKALKRAYKNVTTPELMTHLITWKAYECIKKLNTRMKGETGHLEWQDFIHANPEDYVISLINVADLTEHLNIFDLRVILDNADGDNPIEIVTKSHFEPSTCHNSMLRESAIEQVPELSTNDKYISLDSHKDYSSTYVATKIGEAGCPETGEALLNIIAFQGGKYKINLKGYKTKVPVGYIDMSSIYYKHNELGEKDALTRHLFDMEFTKTSIDKTVTDVMKLLTILDKHRQDILVKDSSVVSKMVRNMVLISVAATREILKTMQENCLQAMNTYKDLLQCRTQKISPLMTNVAKTINFTLLPKYISVDKNIPTDMYSLISEVEELGL